MVIIRWLSEIIQALNTAYIRNSCTEINIFLSVPLCSKLNETPQIPPITGLHLRHPASPFRLLTAFIRLTVPSPFPSPISFAGRFEIWEDRKNDSQKARQNLIHWFLWAARLDSRSFSEPFLDWMGRNGVLSSSSGMAAVTVTALELTDSSNWWHDINQSPLWQDRTFHVLAVLYGIVAAVALVFNNSPTLYLFIFLIVELLSFCLCHRY